ncbi:AcrR family transcriptional regulator [Azospirillum agricola]|uniref:TetR/AcrR family transcriptional regulator n=1 Tax=Azospirillum agricola TaxID=1720247 RepID=UPI002D7F9790|nr:TetR/AcrR family transcriptional regulator [Azospirillum agricola]MBP2230977.1 AcrR family transcriptional regulator [Azospirillum agricola]
MADTDRPAEIVAEIDARPPDFHPADLHSSDVRPRGWARCRALLDAAAALFVEKGFAATSLTDILERAGGSRTTLYRHFGDKEGLFRRMMEEHCARVLNGMAAPAAATGTPRDDPEERLNEFGLHIARTLAAPETMAILRTLVSEGGRIPDLSQSFLRAGPEETNRRLADCLRGLAALGRIRIQDADVAARAFTGMITGNLLLKRLILPAEPVAPAELEREVRAAVRMFLRGVGPAPGVPATG